MGMGFHSWGSAIASSFMDWRICGRQACKVGNGHVMRTPARHPPGTSKHPSPGGLAKPPITAALGFSLGEDKAKLGRSSTASAAWAIPNRKTRISRTESRAPAVSPRTRSHVRRGRLLIIDGMSAGRFKSRKPTPTAQPTIPRILFPPQGFALAAYPSDKHARATAYGHNRGSPSNRRRDRLLVASPAPAGALS